MGRPKSLEDRVKVALYLEALQKAKLDRLAERTGRPWSALVREGIDWVLAKYKRAK